MLNNQKSMQLKVVKSDSPYFNNIKCAKCGHIERVSFNVVDYKCAKCNN